MASRSTRIAGILAIVLILVAAFEVLSFVVFSMNKNNSALLMRVLYPVDVSDADIRQYVENRDDKLGWPMKNDARLDNDSHRERPSPANNAIGNPKYCLEVYGDSFTYSSEVDDHAAWPNRLAEKIKCKVLNFGIPGYGVDQAVLRHELNERFANHAALVIYTYDIQRNLTQQMSLFAPTEKRLDYKPRFIVSGDGGLTLIEIPSGTVDDYGKVFLNPSSGLVEERFLPDTGGLWSKFTLTFPYSLSVFRLIRKIYIEIDFEKLWIGEFKRGFKDFNYPRYYFRDEKLRLEARVLLEELVKRFQNNCGFKNQSCYIILIPDIEYMNGDFHAEQLMAYYFQNANTWPNYYDMTPFLRVAMEPDYCLYFARKGCEGHFNATGNDIVSAFFLRNIPVDFRN